MLMDTVELALQSLLIRAAEIENARKIYLDWLKERKEKKRKESEAPNAKRTTT